MIFTSPWPAVAIPEKHFSEFVFAETSARATLPAFIDGATGRTLTHGEVRDGAYRAAAGLALRGLRKGERVAIVSTNCPEFAVAFHGIALAGGVVTTANPHYTVDELAYQLNDSAARFVITAPPFLENVRAAVARSRVAQTFLFGVAADVTPFSTLMESSEAPPRVDIDPNNDLLALPYSSGTTGRAKGVMITHRNAVAMHSMVAPLLSPMQGETGLAVLPYFHAFGMFNMNGALLSGMKVVTMPRFDIEEYVAMIERHRVTRLGVVPPILLALAKHPAVERHDLSSLRFIFCGAAPLGTELQRAASDRLKVNVRQAYGMTEAVVGCTHWVPSDAEGPAGSVGRLLPNMEARVVDPASGEDLGPNQRGELLVRGPNVMRGYLNNPAATAATIDAQRWLHSGDVALFDDRGYLYIVDRIKELIKVKGYQVAPAQLEAILLQHPAVADAAVIGVLDEEAGELPKAFVVRRAPDADADAIMADTARHLAPHERIRSIEFVDAIPKSPSGKILRRVLRARGAGAMDPSSSLRM